MDRFTAWLSDLEREKIQERAKSLGTSENLIVRFAIRSYFGMNIPEEAQKTESQQIGAA